MLGRLAQCFPATTAGVSLCDSVTSLPPVKEVKDIFDNDAKQSNAYVPTTSLSTQLSGLKRRSTSIGRLAHQTSTASNPSVCAFFVTVSSKNPPLSAHDLSRSFQSRVIADEDRYSRFSASLDSDATHFHQLQGYNARSSINPTMHPLAGRDEVKRLVEDMIMNSSFGATKGSSSSPTVPTAWEGKVSSGPLGSSETISAAKISEARRAGKTHESLLFFSVNHAIGDGVSLGVVMGDLSDERDNIRAIVDKEIAKRKANDKKNKARGWRGFLQRLMRQLSRLWWFARGAAIVLKEQLYLTLFSARSPLEQIIALAASRAAADSSSARVKRSISWVDAMSVEEASAIAKSIGVGKGSSTINDLFVACVGKAIQKQIEEHKKREGPSLKHLKSDRLKVLVPVHLYGGVLLPGQSIGNRIGGFCAELDLSSASSPSRVSSVSSSLSIAKDTPIALFAYGLGQFMGLGFVPRFVARWALHSGTKGASFALSNVRGPDFPLHYDGRKVESVAGFLPPPPGCPIGIIVQ